METSYTKIVAQSMWMVWENTFDFFTRFRSESIWRFGICKLVIRRHYGKRIECHDGHQIETGDWIGELHLDNQQVIELSRAVGADRAGIMTARMLRRGMKQISHAMQTSPELAKVKAITGITLLHRGIIHGLGFEQHPITSKWAKGFTKIYLRYLLRILHPEGKQRVKQAGEKLEPRMLVISKQALFDRWTEKDKDKNLRTIYI
ncbi:polysaccharide deacetylase [Paenibacillus selenitireducens]|uniref:Polysaccharide deacetylase n=1 Tax=Paenibacillus selenitireducens TaxID=1324314 RepID=A0A1T2XK48_9BACL|nr:polysaccharide deacetylase [Paenibacillus selenitireducens]OPA80096.1 polysaccharide deacetylase [Paenibacillus selenitireducens]